MQHGAMVSCVFVAFAMVSTSGCGETEVSGPQALQDPCVRGNVNVGSDLEDGSECANFGYTDCPGGLASDCMNYCAFDFCQPEPCESSEDCLATFGAPGGIEEWQCNEYVVSDRGYGNWCETAEGCPEGSLGCPCLPGDECGADPFGSGNMVCVEGECESTCPSACIVGSVCCGGAFCSGNCIGTPCCS